MLVGPRQVVDAQLAGQAGKPVAVELVGQQLHNGGVGREEGEVVKRSPVGSYEEGGWLQRGGEGGGGRQRDVNGGMQREYYDIHCFIRICLQFLSRLESQIMGRLRKAARQL